MKPFNLTSGFIHKIRQQKKELDKFLYWLSEHVGPDECILTIRGQSLYKLFFEAPFRIGDKPKISRWLPNDKAPSFILIARGKEKYLSFPLDGNWHRIGGGTFFILCENKERFKNHFLPFRFGLSLKEKRLAMKIARMTLEKFLKGERPVRPEDLGDFSRRFLTQTDLDVALWVNGEIRGSFVLEKKPLGEGIMEATIKASRDMRFKPLNYEELQDTRIEITLISDLKLPLGNDYLEKNQILPHQGYRLIFKDKKGWFLPEVFNVRRFRGLNEFLDNLAQEKAGLPSQIWKKREAAIEIFDVEDFIEGLKPDEIFDLYGPIIIPNNVENGATNESYLRKRLEMAADWLLNIQEGDGNFPPIINPLTGSRAQIDWPRSAFSAWALAEFGLIGKEKKYQQAAEKHFQFLNKYIWEPGFNVQPLTLAYAGQGVLSLFKMTQKEEYYLAAIKMAEKILTISGQIVFESITFQQIASFFAELAKWESRFLEPAQKFAHIARTDFENHLAKKAPQNLAVQAELVNVFNKLFGLTGNSDYKEFSYKVANWLINYQLSQGPDGIFGPFAESTISGFVYTRGTGKILEVLADLPEYRANAEKALAWLLAMQYTEENAFFVPTEFRSKIIGGFRHDYFNSEVWIDSAGHFILAASRFLKVQKTKF